LARNIVESYGIEKSTGTIFIMVQRISGLYKQVFSNSAERKVKGSELELRVDVDGARPLNVISGDVYSDLGRIPKYLGSFAFEGVKKREASAKEILLIGESGEFSCDLVHFSDIQVTIPADSRSLEAVVQWPTGSGSSSRFLCKYVSEHFRRIQLEHDYEQGVVPLEPYDHADLLSPSPIRSHPISIRDAFAEAGIDITVVKEKQDSVPPPKGIPGEGSVWTDSELHEAMLKHFTLLKDEPQWKVWLLSANEYVMSNISGIMIDREGKKRRGCAVFQSGTGWSSAEEKRMRLFIYVHELGHCFNLHHPWEKPQANPFAEAKGHATLSWMNVPWTYYSSEESRGEEAFWKNFNFQFSASELMHLRHGFRNDVIFGGNIFERIDANSPIC
jgi:hypothetical protein